jgi:hypothetical protein
VEGIDSSTVDLNIQNEQDAAFFNEWIAQLSTNIGQGDENSLALPLDQSPLSNVPYQDSPLDQLTSTSGEAASYTALFSNPELSYVDLNVPGSSPYSLDQDLLNTSSGGLYPVASDSQYVRSKPTDGYNMSTIPNQVGTIGQRQHYSDAPSIAPNYFMPNMNVALNYGRSNEYESDYASLSRKRAPHSGNKVEVSPAKDEQELPSKEEVTHERKKKCRVVYRLVRNFQTNSPPSSIMLLLFTRNQRVQVVELAPPTNLPPTLNMIDLGWRIIPINQFQVWPMKQITILIF